MEGRRLVLVLNYGDHTFSLANWYAPIDNSLTFYQNAMKQLDELGYTTKIIGADFNCM